MPYGDSFAQLEETPDGSFVVIRVKLPVEGELAKSNKSTNLTDPKQWADVYDQFGQPTEMQYLANVIVPHRRAAQFRRMGRIARPQRVNTKNRVVM